MKQVLPQRRESLQEKAAQYILTCLRYVPRAWCCLKMLHLICNGRCLEVFQEQHISCYCRRMLQEVTLLMCLLVEVNRAHA